MQLLPARMTDRGSFLLKASGFEQAVSDGEHSCYGRCDGEPIPRGQQTWWRRESYEYDEWEGMCRRCAFASTRFYGGPYPGDRLRRKPRGFMWTLNLKREPDPSW